MDEAITLTTTVLPSLKRKILLKGFLFAACGVLLWLYAGTQWDVRVLQKWGWFVFIIGFVAIAAGLLPYRRCVRLQEQPHQLILHGKGDITYLIEGNVVCTLPLSWIERAVFCKETHPYGIALFFCFVEKELLNSSFMKQRLTRSRQIYQCDLFLPYFQERAWRELQEWLR